MSAAKLVKSLHRKLFKGSIYDPEDLSQEAWIACHTARDREGNANTSPGFTSSVIFRSLHHLARKQPPLSAPLEEAGDIAERGQGERDVYCYLRALPPLTRDVIERYFGIGTEAQTQGSIARDMSLSTYQVRAMLSAGLKLLREAAGE